MPSSPRWLVLHGRRDEALKAVQRLGIEREEAEKDILTITGVDHERLEKSYWQGITMIFRKEYRRRTSLALMILGAAQLSGIDGVLYVSRLVTFPFAFAYTCYSTHQLCSSKPVFQNKQPGSSHQESAQSSCYSSQSQPWL
jgi:hypothetical protein